MAEVVVLGRAYPCRDAAAVALGLSRRTVDKRTQRYGETWEQAAATLVQKASANAVTVRGRAYSSKQDACAAYGIKAAAVRDGRRWHGGTWEQAFERLVGDRKAAGGVVVAGQVWPDLAAACAHHGYAERDVAKRAREAGRTIRDTLERLIKRRIQLTNPGVQGTVDGWEVTAVKGPSARGELRSHVTALLVGRPAWAVEAARRCGR